MLKMLQKHLTNKINFSETITGVILPPCTAGTNLHDYIKISGPALVNT